MQSLLPRSNHFCREGQANQCSTKEPLKLHVKHLNCRQTNFYKSGYSPQFPNFDYCKLQPNSLISCQANIRYMDQSNSTQVIKGAINVFILIAIVISLFQELNFSSSSSPDQAKPAAPEVNVNGTKVEGLVILTSDHFRKDFKDLLIQKDLNVQIKQFPFEGNEYWINLFLTHGHMLVVFFLVSRYQSETEQSKKTKWMVLGMALVFGWMFFAPNLKPKQLALEYKGVKVYQHENFSKEEVAAKLEHYEEESAFGLDPAPQPARAEPVVSQPQFVEAEDEINDF